MSYKVKIQTFEGPFDLLVYLIESARMDIYDIKVSEITEQYLAHLSQMQRLDVKPASEFMVLAANLIEIKSKMLLPRINEQGEEVIEEDPRASLVERLVEYKKYKAAAQAFSELEDEGFLIAEKPQEDISEFLNEPEEILKLDAQKLMNAFETFIGRKKKVSEIRKNYENVQRKKVTAEERNAFIKSLFEQSPAATYSFRDTVKDADDKYDITLSFTSIMELVKQRQLEAEQKRLFGDIKVKKGKSFGCEASEAERQKEDIDDKQ